MMVSPYQLKNIHNWSVAHFLQEKKKEKEKSFSVPFKVNILVWGFENCDIVAHHLALCLRVRRLIEEDN